MAYNTSFTRFKSVELAGVDCGNYLKVTTPQNVVRLSGVYRGILALGQCAAMVRVNAGDTIIGGRLAWQSDAVTSPASFLAAGDPYACARFAGPCYTLSPSQPSTAGNVNGTDCGVFTKTGHNGDGCGLYYTYTCETDILVTNLYGPDLATAGGFSGAGTASSATGLASAVWTAGQIVLTVDVLRA